MVVVLEEAATTIDDTHDRPRDGGVEIITVILDQDGSQTPMFRDVHTEAVDRLGHHPARYPVLRHRHARHLVEHAGTVVGVRSAAPCRQTGVIIEGLREDVAVQTTVIDIDLLPAMIYRAHLLPDETDEDDDPFRRAVCRHRLYVEVAGGAATLLLQGQDLGRWLTPVQDPGRLMKGAANAEEIHPLMLARAGKTVMTVV